jgi:hypothetical protein
MASPTTCALVIGGVMLTIVGLSLFARLIGMLPIVILLLLLLLGFLYWLPRENTT